MSRVLDGVNTRSAEVREPGSGRQPFGHERERRESRKISVPVRRLDDRTTIEMPPMSEDDTQLEQIPSGPVPVPLFDDEDEPAGSQQEPAPLDPSDADVEGHGSWGIGDKA
jgi:hypothetical protein